MNATSPVAAPARRFVRWHRRVLGLCLIIFACELGLFLLIFPWLSSWGSNWVPVHSVRFAPLWMNPYLRGALSGLGLLNLYVALAEAKRQFRLLFVKTDSSDLGDTT